MLVDLNKPASIVAWWAVYPERHDACLDGWAKSYPELAPMVREAQRRIAADPRLSALLVRAAAARRAAQVVESAPDRLDERYALTP
jgi:hypothetical protein